MRNLTNILQLTVALGMGVFGGLLWSQQFYMTVPSSRDPGTNPDSFMAISDRAAHLARSIEFAQQEIIHLREERDDALMQQPSGGVFPREGEEASSVGRAASSTMSSASVLQHQVDLQIEFQDLLRKQQYPTDCSQSRILLTFNTTKAADGFAREIQDMSRLLQVAMATKRCLVVREGWQSAYQPESCQSSTSWPCLWQPLSSCTSESILGSPELMDANISASLAIDTTLINTAYFDTYLYGPTRIQAGRKWPWGPHAMVDVIPRWERAMGRFWIRAQLSHYLWQPSPWLAEQIEARTPVLFDSNDADHRYIAMHIRFTDNRSALKREFGRDATKTRDFANFMKHAAILREQYNVSTIYVSTDNDQMIDQTKKRIYRNQQWKFVFQLQVQRGSSKRHLWFEEGRSGAAAGIATDLEILQKADFLIGSHQSNVYRLACQLNTAHHAARYPFEMDRHLSVDVEWFEDP